MTAPAASAWRLLWRDNPGLVQMLGLCPLLAVTTSAVNGLALGLATAGVLITANVTVSALRMAIPDTLRLPAMVLIIAGCTTVALLLLQTFLPELYARIALFVQIIVTNCAILARAEQVARRSTVPRAFADGVGAGLGFGLVLLLAGALREVIGHGSLGADLDLLFGPAASGLCIRFTDDGQLFLLALLPPGGFLVLGVLAALHAHATARKQR